MTEPETTEPPIDLANESMNPPGEASARPDEDGAAGEPVDVLAVSPVVPQAPSGGNPGRKLRWRRLAVLIGIALLLLFALLWRSCGQGAGLGGGPAPSTERRDAPATPMSADADAARKAHAPCRVRVDAGGIQINGKLMASPQAAVAACAPSRLAVVLVTGDAVFGVVEQLEMALRAAQIDIQRQK